MTIPTTNTNGLKATNFYVAISRFPDIVFRAQAATIPDVELGIAYQQTSEQDVAHPGDKMTFPPVRISFIADENLDGYMKLFGWMRDISGFGVPQADTAMYLQRFAQDPSPTTNPDSFSDVLVTVLNANNNPVAQFTFVYAFPAFIGGWTFDTTDDGESFIHFDVDFAYTHFTVNNVSGQ